MLLTSSAVNTERSEFEAYLFLVSNSLWHIPYSALLLHYLLLKIQLRFIMYPLLLNTLKPHKCLYPWFVILLK